MSWILLLLGVLVILVTGVLVILVMFITVKMSRVNDSSNDEIDNSTTKI